LGVECERSRQLSRRRKTIDASNECPSTKILTSQVAVARLACQNVVRRGDVTLSLERQRIGGVYRSSDHDSGGKARDRGAWADTQIAVNHTEAGIGHRLAAEDRETCR
jgi:hypothetical protein